MPVDFIKNGRGFGTVAGRIADPDFQPGQLRPWIDPGTDRVYVTVNRQVKGEMKPVHVPVTNAPVALPRDSWLLIDRAVRRAALPRLTVVNRLRAAGLEYAVPNAMGTMALESTTGSDITDATISMEGTRRGDFDRPEYDSQLLPLPIIHKDFQFPARQIAASRRAGVPLDTTMASLAGRKVAEEVEKLTLGVSANNGYSYAGGTVYGMTNHPDRLTKVLTDPTTWGAGDGPATLVNEVLQMIEQARVAGYYGPFRLIVSSGWGIYLDADYSDTKGDNTLRQRLSMVQGITSIENADYLTGLQILLVQESEETVRIVTGMDVTTLMWETLGGMEVNFKVMAIVVPQIRADHNGNVGIVHGSVP